MRRLGTTSFAVLGLLAFRDWTASELARQMERSLNFMWPRAASGIYVEPRSLEAHGMVTATDVPENKRVRARYSITERGRAALLAWIRRDSTASAFESEAALKLSFSHIATVADVHRLIDELEADARTRTSQLLAIFEDYADGNGPYQDRAHVVGVTSRLYYEHYAAMIAWAKWARTEVDQWRAADASVAYRGRNVIAESLRLFGLNGTRPEGGETRG
jgi:PadR family transcriptional regulator, regulatory protein AphA